MAKNVTAPVKEKSVRTANSEKVSILMIAMNKILCNEHKTSAKESENLPHSMNKVMNKYL